MYFSHAAFSNGAPMVTMPRSADRSAGVRSCVRASMAMMVGTPIRKEMRYFSAYSRQRLGAKSRRMTTSPPAYSVGQGPPEWMPPRWNHGVMFMVRSMGPSGKCIITSCAESTSFTLLIGTPLGRLVVPEV